VVLLPKSPLTLLLVLKPPPVKEGGW